jgi:cyclic pyranopterin phosphate synthase
MDVGATNGWRHDQVVPSADLIRAIDAVFPIDVLQPNYPGEVANRWRYRDGQGEIGVISSVSQPFCGDCTRARLSTDGSVYTCLFATYGTDLRKMLRGGADDLMLSNAIRSIWEARQDRYSEIRSDASAALPKVEMSYIGG